MQTDCSASQLRFEGFEGRQVVGDFDGGAVTSNGGAVLLRVVRMRAGRATRTGRSV